MKCTPLRQDPHSSGLDLHQQAMVPAKALVHQLVPSPLNLPLQCNDFVSLCMLCHSSRFSLSLELSCMQLEGRALRSQLSYAAINHQLGACGQKVSVTVLAGSHTTARWAIGRVTSP